ncbi:MAG: LacI family DNA-binding transcriptional regulator [Opitutaceae bacterium]
MKERITMAQVAARAGVHPTTVSLALRNHPSLPPATRERLHALAVEMGYRPDPALSALAAYRHAKLVHRELPPLAYLADAERELGPAGARTQARHHAGAFARADELGYRLERFAVGEGGLSPRRLGEIFFTRGITGVILAAQRAEHDRLPDLGWARFSAVRIGGVPRSPDLPTVASDCRGIVRLAMHRAWENGYRRLGLVLPGEWEERADFAWSASFLAEQQRLPSAERVPVFTFAATGGAVSGAAPFAAWLQRFRPEVLLASGAGVRPELERLGRAVPQEVALIDLDLEPAARDAGVRHGCERIGALAVDHVVRQMQQNVRGVAESGIAILVAGTWCDGPSLPARCGELALARAG